VVDIGHAGIPVEPLRDLVDIVSGGQARSDVDELANPSFLDEVADRPDEEVAIRAGPTRQVGSSFLPLSASSRSTAKLSRPPSR
jgi:hypothetical protein